MTVAVQGTDRSPYVATQVQIAPASKPMIQRLQALRFIAAALVLTGHVLMEMLQHEMKLGAITPLVDFPWGVGVDIFFLISGFIISHSALDNPRSLTSARKFILQRLIRIWPTYAMFTALMMVAVLLVPAFLAHNVLTLSYVIASFLFIPMPRPDDLRMFPVLGQGWTLNYEMFFYLAFTMALLLPVKLRAPVLWIGGISLILLGQYVALPQPLAFYADPIVGEFLLGILLSVMMKRLPAMPNGARLAIILAPVALFLLNSGDELPRIVSLGIPAFLLVGGVLFLGEKGERLLGASWLVLLGNASYALYLSHTFAVNAVLLFWIKLHLAIPALFFLLTFVVAIVGSVLVYKLLEVPTLQFLKQRLKR